MKNHPNNRSEKLKKLLKDYTGFPQGEIDFKKLNPIYLEDNHKPIFKNNIFDQKPFAVVLKNGFSCENYIYTSDLKKVIFKPDLIHFVILNNIHLAGKKYYLKDVKYFDETVITTIKYWGENYGHWLHDYLPTFQLIEQLGLKEPYRIHLPYDKGHMKDSIEILKIPKDKIIPYEDNYCISAKKLIFVYYGTRYSDRVKNFIRNNLIKSIKPLRKDRRIYVSREDSTMPVVNVVDLPIRKIENEIELRIFLREYGFERVILSKISVKEQIKTFAEAEIIIGAYGAGMINTLFCNPGTKVLEIWSPLCWKNYEISFEYFETMPKFVDKKRLMFEDSDKVRGKIYVDVKKLAGYFEEFSIEKFAK